MIYKQIFQMVDMGIVILDKDFMVFRWNNWMENRTGLNSQEVEGKSLFQFYPDLKAPWFLRNCKAVFTFGNFAFFSQHLHGYCFPIKNTSFSFLEFPYMQQNCTLGPLRDKEGSIQYIYIMVQDVTEIAAYQRRLSFLANRDGLTGIFNRQYFNEQYTLEYQRHVRYGRDLSLIMMDLDYFKKINDQYGHLCGDSVLKTFTELIQERLRSIDLLARYGGEEFILLLPETGSCAATKLAGELRLLIREHTFTFKEISLKLTASFGVSSLGTSGDSREELIRKADAALYKAKKEGRDKVVLAEQ